MSARRTLPQRRYCETVQMIHGKHNTTFAITLGHYEGGFVGEVFISGAKAGSDVDAVARDGAILLSLALQHGVPLDTIKHALTRERDGVASTIIGAVVDNMSSRQKDRQP